MLAAVEREGVCQFSGAVPETLGLEVCSPLLNDVADSNMLVMSVALKGFQFEIFELKFVAELNIHFMLFTLDTFHCPIGSLKAVAISNMLNMSETLDTFQDPIG